MNKYIATQKTTVKAENSIIQPDNYTSIELINIGADAAVVNNNIPLAPGATYSFINEPYVTIGNATEIKFAGVEATKKVLVKIIYYKEEQV